MAHAKEVGVVLNCGDPLLGSMVQNSIVLGVLPVRIEADHCVVISSRTRRFKKEGTY